ncbi:bacillithiol system redox-active protein YtxJ [Niabella terrae]
MEWKELVDMPSLDQINAKSNDRPQLIYKHSTRCNISTVVKNRLNKTPLSEHIDFYYLDLIAHREISNAIAERYQVRHESPQVLLISKGVCIYNESHNGIYMDDILEQVP